MKRLSITALAVAAVGFSGAALAATEYVDLFDAQAIAPAEGFEGSTFEGNEVDFDKRFVFGTAEATVYCGAASIAYVKTDNGDGTYGPPIVDNFMTGGDDGVSICLGGTSITEIPGTNCFNTAAAIPPAGEPMEDYYTAANVTAPVDLDAGKNELQFKLWDYGVDLGNTKLVLELPAACSAEPDSYVKVSGGIGFGLAGRGNSPTHAFDGFIYTIGDYLGGEVNINFRTGDGNCTFTPGAFGKLDIRSSTVAPGALQAVLDNWDVSAGCSNRAQIRFLPKGYNDSLARGGVFIPGELQNPVEIAPFFRWIPLETGNVEVFIKN